MKAPPVASKACPSDPCSIQAVSRTPSAACRGRTWAVAFDEDRADEGALEAVALAALDGELLAGDAETGRWFTERSNLHLKKSDVVTPDLTRHFRPVVYWHGRAVVGHPDAAREEELV